MVALPREFIKTILAKKLDGDWKAKIWGENAQKAILKLNKQQI